jgi:hypothetical protein
MTRPLTERELELIQFYARCRLGLSPQVSTASGASATKLSPPFVPVLPSPSIGGFCRGRIIVLPVPATCGIWL